MKLRIKNFEIMLVTLLAVLTGLGCIFNNVHGKLGSYNLYKLLPELVPLAVLYLSYLCLNLITIPYLLQKIKNRNGEKSLMLATTSVFSQFVIIMYLIGPICNFLTYYLNPKHEALTNLPLFGYVGFHAQPFNNTFGGFANGFVIVFIYSIYAFFREAAIYKIELSLKSKSFKILLFNRLAFSLIVYIGIVSILLTFQLVTFATFYFVYYFVIPSLVLFGALNIYWLFPSIINKSISKKKFFVREFLLLVSITLFFSIFFGSSWSFTLFFSLLIVQLVVVMPFSWLIFQQQKDEILELAGTQMQLSRSKADLQFLRSQINPHFLFNSLNTLYGTAIIERSARTAEGIQILGDMMRFMIHENSLDFIPMYKEIEYLKNYVSLQKMRISDKEKMSIQENIDEQHCNHKIAPMLLIPFVENAFKHGIDFSQKFWINIILKCDEQTIHFEVRNSLPAISDNKDPERDNSGIGIVNVKERLALIYGDRYSLYYGKENDEFVAKLLIKVS